MTTNPYDASIAPAATAVGQILSSLSNSFQGLLPIGLGLIALVMAAFWLLARARRFGAKAN